MARILVIDDDMYSLGQIDALLRALKHEVVTAQDGETGLQMALQHRPALIILDAAMPKKDGFQVLDELRRFRRTAQTPVLVLSDFAVNWDRDEARRRGATECLPKPLDRNALMNRLELLLPKGG